MFKLLAKAFSSIGWRDSLTDQRRERRAKVWDRLLKNTTIVGGGLAITGTGYLLTNERIADRQSMFVFVLGAIAALIVGAAVFSLAARVRMAQYHGQFFGPIKAGMTIFALWLLGSGLMFGGFVGLILTAFVALAPLPPPAPVSLSERTVAAPLPTPPPPLNSKIVGVISNFVDGDTFDIRDVRIRPLGYDTPERGAKCRSTVGPVDVFQSATQALIAFGEGKSVTCEDTGKRDRDGRTIAVCQVDGKELGAYMVAQGWGRDWPMYSNGQYCPQELDARAGKRGIWGLECPTDLWGKAGEPRDYRNPPETGKECGEKQ